MTDKSYFMNFEAESQLKTETTGLSAWESKYHGEHLTILKTRLGSVRRAVRSTVSNGSELFLSHCKALVCLFDWFRSFFKTKDYLGSVPFVRA